MPEHEGAYQELRGQDHETSLDILAEEFKKIDAEAAAKEHAVQTATSLYRTYLEKIRDNQTQFNSKLYDVLVTAVTSIEVMDVGSLEQSVHNACEDGACGELYEELLTILRRPPVAESVNGEPPEEAA